MVGKKIRHCTHTHTNTDIYIFQNADMSNYVELILVLCLIKYADRTSHIYLFKSL